MMSEGDSSAEAQSTVSRHQDLLQVLNSIQSGDLNSVLRQQPQLVQGMVCGSNWRYATFLEDALLVRVQAPHTQLSPHTA